VSLSPNDLSIGGSITPCVIDAKRYARRQEYVDAIVAVSDSDDEALTLEHRTCLAESFVDGYGVDEIVAAGVTPQDIRDEPDAGPGEMGLEFSDEQAASLYDRLTGCMDVRAFLIEGIGGDDLSQESMDCLDENLTDDLIERFLITGFTQGDAGFEDNPELEDELDEAVGPCLIQPGSDRPRRRLSTLDVTLS
jgi:hypothetical protein